ncbi:MAG: hypothetical protein ACLFQK_08190, partial [Fibrobacterota bacterium]
MMKRILTVLLLLVLSAYPEYSHSERDSLRKVYLRYKTATNNDALGMSSPEASEVSSLDPSDKAYVTRKYGESPSFEDFLKERSYRDSIDKAEKADSVMVEREGTIFEKKEYDEFE